MSPLPCFPWRKHSSRQWTPAGKKPDACIFTRRLTHDAVQGYQGDEKDFAVFDRDHMSDEKPQGSRSTMLDIHSEMLTHAVCDENLLCLITQTNRLQLHKLPLCLHITPCKPSTTTSLAL